MNDCRKRPAIAIVLDALNRGGAEKVAISLANSIHAAGYRIVLVTTRLPGEIACELDSTTQRFSLSRTGRFDLAALKRLASFLDSEQIDIVHSHNHSSSYYCRLARIFCRNKWKHIVHDHHGPAVDSCKLLLLDRLLLGNVDFFIAASSALRQRAVKRVGIPVEKAVFIANGVPLPPMPERGPADPLVIVQVARVEPVKNIALAVAAAAQLKESGLHFLWKVVGRTTDALFFQELRKEVLDRRLEDQFFFEGELSDIPGVLARAHIGVLTSRVEAMSIALLEYMAHGLPVVMTEVGQSSDVLRASGGGRIVGQGDAEALAESIAQLIRSDAEREAWGMSNRTYVAANYSDRAMAESVMNIYEKVLENEC